MDFMWGGVFSWLRDHAKGGSTENCEYIANRCESDIIILGSSRATHHYVPQIIEDSLGISCYNCGEEGNGIVLAYGRFKMLTERYKPKLIIYEMTPGYDYGSNEPNTKYLGYLRPYYRIKSIKSIISVFDDNLSFLKMKSKMYQNTGKLLPNIIDCIIFRDNKKGYAPLYGKIDTDKVNEISENKGYVVDSVKLRYLEQIIVDAKRMDIPIVFMISPKYGLNSDVSIYQPEIALCEKYNMPFCNFVDYPPIANDADYFQDLEHMNDHGAVTYTQMLVKEMLNNNIYH